MNVLFAHAGLCDCPNVEFLQRMRQIGESICRLDDVEMIGGFDAGNAGFERTDLFVCVLDIMTPGLEHLMTWVLSERRGPSKPCRFFLPKGRAMPCDLPRLLSRKREGLSDAAIAYWTYPNPIVYEDDAVIAGTIDNFAYYARRARSCEVVRATH